MSTVAIIDYGMGNLGSVANALHFLGAKPQIVSRPDEVGQYERVIVPGVGSFSTAMDHLIESGMIESLERVRSKGVPLLGICLGMQLFCLSSEEEGYRDGLGWINARVVRFPVSPEFNVPHMGWDDIHHSYEHPLIQNIPDGSDFYFVHSFYVSCADKKNILMAGDYGVNYCAAFVQGNVAGMQFHPEKSQQAGLRLLKNFIEWTPC